MFLSQLGFLERGMAMRGRSRTRATWSRIAAGLLVALLVQAAGTDAAAQVAQPEPVPDLVGPAQPPEKAVSAEKSHPEYDPLGMRLGGFIFSPSILVGEEYEDNVFSTHSNEKSDFITHVHPAFDLVSDWDVHALALHAEADVLQYSRFSSENAGNIIVSGGGRLDILQGQYLELNAGYQSLQEDRSSPDSIEAVLLAGGTLARTPTQYSVETGNMKYVYSPGLIKFALDAGVINYQFTNTPTTNGGLAINSDRNRAEYTLTPKIGYEFLPGYQVYFQASGDSHDYVEKFDATPDRLQRNSAGYAAAVGVDFDISALITGTIFAGYEGQFYSDPRLSAIQGDYGGGSLLWNITDFTSVKLSFSRAIEDTIVVGSSGFWATQTGLSVEQEVYDDLLVSGGFTYIDSDYKGTPLTDDQYDLKATAAWKLNRNFEIDISTDWLRQTSTVEAGGFGQQITQLALKAKL